MTFDDYTYETLVYIFAGAVVVFFGLDISTVDIDKIYV